MCESSNLVKYQPVGIDINYVFICSSSISHYEQLTVQSMDYILEVVSVCGYKKYCQNNVLATKR